jgi:hypothetical protein
VEQEAEEMVVQVFLYQKDLLLMAVQQEEQVIMELGETEEMVAPVLAVAVQEQV